MSWIVGEMVLNVPGHEKHYVRRVLDERTAACSCDQAYLVTKAGPVALDLIAREEDRKVERRAERGMLIP